jgi:hypothetical protein
VDFPPTQPDFPQAFAQRGAAAWVANTGYGYGMDDAVAASEQLMLFFTQEMGVRNAVPIGEALVNAKQRYVGWTPSGGFSVYDEKSMIEATLYGLPMLKVQMPITRPVSTGGITSLSGSRFSLGGRLGTQGITVTVKLTPTSQSTDSGRYYSLGGIVQASPGRPIQPRGTLAAVGLSGFELRGMLLISSTYADVAGLNPVVSAPVTDTADVFAEPPFEADGWFPAKFWAANRFGDKVRLSIIGGQFNRKGGIQRLFSDMVLESYYAGSLETDFLPPTIWSALGHASGQGVQFTVDAEDLDSGLARVLITYNVPNGKGGGTWRSIDLKLDPKTLLWTDNVPGLNVFSVEFFVQSLDQAGNVAVSANKGSYFSGDLSILYLPIMMRNAQR